MNHGGSGLQVQELRKEKQRSADIDEIILRSERAILGRPLAGKTVLVTSGACREPIDDVRILTTRSSGRMGQEIALEAYRLGAAVTIIHNGTLPCVDNVFVETAGEMKQAVDVYIKKDNPDLYISAAAISDFAPKRREGKIKSGKLATIDLFPLPKLIDPLMETKGTRVVAFKIGRNPLPEAKALLERGAWMVITNTPESMGTATGAYRVVTGSDKKGKPVSGTKEEIADRIWQAILSGIKRNDGV